MKPAGLATDPVIEHAPDRNKKTTVSKHYYETSIHHLLGELKRIDLLIIAEVEISRQQDASEVNLMKMYGISENEIDTLMQEAVAAIKDDPVKQTRAE